MAVGANGAVGGKGGVGEYGVVCDGGVFTGSAAPEADTDVGPADPDTEEPPDATAALGGGAAAGVAQQACGSARKAASSLSRKVLARGLCTASATASASEADPSPDSAAGGDGWYGDDTRLWHGRDDAVDGGEARSGGCGASQRLVAVGVDGMRGEGAISRQSKYMYKMCYIQTYYDTSYDSFRATQAVRYEVLGYRYVW